MIRGVSIAVTATVLMAWLAGCTRQADNPTKFTELSRAKSAGVDVVMLTSTAALKPGKDQVFLEFRSSSDGRLVDAGAVKVSATMPMAGMPPMIGATSVERSDTAGRYRVATDLNMSGSWRIGVEWDGPAGRGTVSLPGVVR
jgi:hypothetical protein